MRGTTRRWVPVLMGGGADPLAYRKKVIATTPIAYWPLDETSGTAATNYGSIGDTANAVYDGVGLVLADTAGPSGTCLAPKFPAGTARVNLYSAALNTGINRQEISLMCWVKVTEAAVWSDATSRRCVSLLGASFIIRIVKTATANRMELYYSDGTTADLVNIATSAPTGWTQFVITVTKTGDQLIAYINGSQSGATQTGIGTASGNLVATLNNVGSYDQLYGNPFNGWLADVAIWDRVLTPTEVAALANPT